MKRTLETQTPVFTFSVTDKFTTVATTLISFRHAAHPYTEEEVTLLPDSENWPHVLLQLFDGGRTRGGEEYFNFRRKFALKTGRQRTEGKT